MKTNFLRKSALAVFTLTTASFYFAQETDSEKSIDEVVLVGTVDIAKDRKTPVAVSTIKESAIVEKLGNQEFPEILNSTPSVYATKSGGGFGDSKINIRGFGNENIAVMVNGMPVNDMEGGKVYWSNWAGISDVTSAMQVQRGLGASKLAIASVGGTINIVTRAADKKKGGNLVIGIGNDGYHKASFSYNTGKSAGGWSTSFLLSRTAGAMYANGTDFEAYNYYLAIGYQPSVKHDLQFMVTGAPQVHDQRYVQSTISTYLKYGVNGRPNRKYNPGQGFLNGREYAWSTNFYHKPVAQLTWDWKMSDRNKLSTVLYASLGRGGGSGSLVAPKDVYLDPADEPANAAIKNADGTLNIDAMYSINAANPTAPKYVRRISANEHDWYGFLTNFTHKFNENLQLSAGLDGRYYKGYHFQALTDMFGASSYKDTRNEIARERLVTDTYNIQVPWNVFDRIDNTYVGFNNNGEVLWGGVFGQLEYSDDRLSAFIQGAISSQGYQRIDHFIKPGKLAIPTNPLSGMNTKTGFNYFTGFNAKAGINYNIDAHHNVFANAGYYEKQPFFAAVYPNNRNYLNQNLTNEKILGLELGYSFRSSRFNANLNLYRTSWKDRYMPMSTRFNDAYTLNNGVLTSVGSITGRTSVFGITEIHQGIEVDANLRVADALTLTGMFSIGDWYYEGNATASYITDNSETIYNAAGQAVEDVTLYLDKVKVGGSAQMTASVGAKIEPVKGLALNADWRFVDKLYSDISPNKFEKEKHNGSLQLPSYNLLDLGISYKLDIGNGQSFTFRGNVYNVLDTTYIAESRTNIHANDVMPGSTKTYKEAEKTYKGIATANQVFFGYGRTWNASVTFSF